MKINIEVVIGILVLIFTSVSFFWLWRDRKKRAPIINNCYHFGQSLLYINILNNASYHLEINKAYTIRTIFRKIRRYITATLPGRNSDHSINVDTFTAVNPISDIGEFYIYLDEKGDELKKLKIIIKPNAGTCRYNYVPVVGEK